MSVNRRLFLGALAGLPAIATVKSIPAGAWIMPSQPGVGEGVGEVWGLRFSASGAIPAAIPQRRSRSAVPAWHPEFR